MQDSTKSFSFFFNYTFMKIHILLILLLLSSFCRGGITNKVKDFHFRTISPEDGFYYDGVSSIVQDKLGYIWVVMANEVYRFDGYHYKRYYSQFEIPQNVGKLYFESINSDSNGDIYVASNNGLFLYNWNSDTFKLVFPQRLYKVKEDQKRNLWICGENLVGILNREYWTYTSAVPDRYPELKTQVIHVHGEDVFVGTINGEVYRFDYTNKELILYSTLPGDYRIVDIKTEHDWMWILTQTAGLYKVHLKTRQLENEYRWFCTQDNQYVPAKTLYLDKEQRIWIGTQRGLYVMNTLTDEYTHYTKSESGAFSLPNSSIWTIYEDNQQNLWIGTYSGGLCYLNFHENSRFKNYFSIDQQLSHNVVSAFAEEKEFIWIGTEGGGLNRMNKETGAFTYFKHGSGGNTLSYDNVKSLVFDSQNNLWIGMFMAGLDRLDIRRKVFTNFTNSGISNDTRKLVLEGDSGLWIANQSNADLSYYSFSQNRFFNYDIDALYSSRISDICKSRDGSLWIAKEDQLLKMDVRSRNTKQIISPKLRNLQIETIRVDEQGDVWLGTIGTGLIRYSEEKNVAEIYDGILKYNISAIYSICMDDSGNPWMGTDNGLFKYDKSSGVFYRFDKRDGIQGAVFNPKASMKGQNGELYFGGANGVTVVYPDKVKVNDFVPTARITDFYIDNQIVTTVTKETPLTKPVNLIERIVLTHEDTSFGFRFSSDNYLIPEKNMFKYRLRGYDNRWIETDASNRVASYTRVPAGDYIFEVLVANNDGVWNHLPTSIQIKCLPAPWLSWWAYTLYLMTIIGIFFWIVYYYYNRKKQRLERYMDNLEMEHKEEMHQAQLRFFTNISHEFRTPLFLMMSSLDKLKGDGLGGRHYNLLNGNTKRLLNLVDELMDFRTVENGKMKLHLSNVSPNELIRALIEDFKDYAVSKEISFEVLFDLRLDDTFPVDVRCLEKIVLNLLNNAFKFTQKGGVITIRTYYDITVFQTGFKYHYQEGGDIHDRLFGIVVSDSGIGISPESIANVFTRFYKVDTSDSQTHIGSGIGLALVKSIVLLHKGVMGVYSERNSGSDFLVALNRSADVYDRSDILSDRQEGEKSRMVRDQNNVVGAEVQEKRPKDLIVNTVVPKLRQSKRILLVEDNESVRSIVNEALSKYYDVIEATNGVEASGLLEKMEIDLILSDVMMPLKDGITLCREIKSNMDTSHIPFVMLTARSGMENRLEGAESGADAYFEKPINMQLLVQSIQNIFIRQQHLREHYAKFYFADSQEITSNKQDNEFMKRLTAVIDSCMDQSDLDVNYIAAQMFMSRSKLYSKIKTMTDKSIVEFVRSYRLHKAARLLIDENLSASDVMAQVGIESNSYFTRAFKAEFGMTPTAFIQNNRKK